MAREASRSIALAAVALLVLVPTVTAFHAPTIIEGKRTYLRPASASGPLPVPVSPVSNQLLYHGGPILKSPKVFLVFWGFGAIPGVDGDPKNEAPYLIRFFQGLGGTSWNNLQTEYSSTTQGAITNPANVLAGIWWDNATTPPAIPDAYLATEAARAANHFGYSPDANYFLVVPSQHWERGNLPNPAGYYCAYHSTTSDGAGHTISYTNLPYIPDSDTFFGCGDHFVNAGPAGDLDGVSIVASHEYAESVTDPLINAWYDANGQENGDKCAWVRSGPGRTQNIHLSTGDFAVQGMWSNAIAGCAIAYP